MSLTSQTSSVADTITADVIRNALAVAVEETSVVVVRSAHSTQIQEGADAAGALLDATGQLVAQSAATSVMHGASLRCGLQSLLSEIDTADMRPGDVFACNDPYRGGIHANDIMVFRPVFAGGRVRWFGATVVHVADVGGTAVGGLGSQAESTYAEGLLMPPVRLYREGEVNSDVLGIIERNSRTPAKVIGDIQALVAGTAVVARSVEELVERYGVDVIEDHCNRYLDYAETRLGEELRRIPSGHYQGSYTVDGDGVTPGATFEVVVNITLDGPDITIDLTGTAAQSGGAINASISQALSGILYAVRCFVDPSIPMNEGCFRRIHTILPPGSLVNPNPPAACGGRVPTVSAVVEAILEALSAAVPDRAVAASALIQVFTMLGKLANGEPWLTLGYEFGGIGARHGEDGPDATGAYFLGGRSVIPQVEPLEAQLPFRVEQCRLIPDSGGPGRWRGGLGVEMVMRMTSRADLSVRGDRITMPPVGRQGGSAGAPGRFAIIRADGTTEPLAVKQQGIVLHPGDRFIIATSGGGGLGPPAEREPAAIRADLTSGRLTAVGVEAYREGAPS